MEQDKVKQLEAYMHAPRPFEYKDSDYAAISHLIQMADELIRLYPDWASEVRVQLSNDLWMRINYHARAGLLAHGFNHFYGPPGSMQRGLKQYCEPALTERHVRVALADLDRYLSEQMQGEAWPNRASALHVRCQCHRWLDAYHLALQDAQQLVETRQHSDSYLLLSQVYFDFGSNEQALAAATEAVKRANDPPQLADALGARAQIYKMIGNQAAFEIDMEQQKRAAERSEAFVKRALGTLLGS
jgi:tetratricopeptide (TPR) repeat protein